MTKVYQMLGEHGFGSYRAEDGAFVRVDAAPEALLTPGFVDIHIHGAFGIDFMSASADDLLVLAKKLRECAYEAFLPTTITASSESVRAALANLPDHPMIWGFHLEGPFISPEFPGAQPPEFIESPAKASPEWDDILADPRLKVVTLAPEVPQALDLVLKLNRRGVISSMGHTNATFEEARRGFEFGAHHTTHTYNAMRGLHHREAGTVGYALHNSDLIGELIYDRKHVCREAAALLFDRKSPHAVVAVSDSTAATGLPRGTELTMWGHACTVLDKEVRLTDSGALAGSAITLHDAFQNLCEDFGPETAIRACCHNPRLALRVTQPPTLYAEWNFDWELQELHEIPR